MEMHVLINHGPEEYKCFETRVLDWEGDEGAHNQKWRTNESDDWI